MLNNMVASFTTSNQVGEAMKNTQNQKVNKKRCFKRKFQELKIQKKYN